MRFLVDAVFFISLSDGDRGFPFITDPGGIADIETVQRLKAACESHLAILDQSEIDRTNESWENSRRSKSKLKTEAS